MSEKIYGDFASNADINELAVNLRKNDEMDEIRQLAKETGIHEEQAERFISGDILYLASVSEEDPKQSEEDGIKSAEVKSYTIADVREKLEKELKIYIDGDSKYTVEKLIERCEKSPELLNNIMQPHKSYDKAFQYFYEKSRSVGHKMPHGNMVYLDNDKAVELAIEYFNRDDAAEEAKKAQQEKERKARQKEEEEKRKKQMSDKKKNEATEPAKKSKPAAAPAPKVVNSETAKKPKEVIGQLSLFDFGA